MNNIRAKLEQIFEFEKELNHLLDEEKYESFQQQQELFGDQLKDFLNKYSVRVQTISSSNKSLRIRDKTHRPCCNDLNKLVMCSKW